MPGPAGLQGRLRQMRVPVHAYLRAQAGEGAIEEGVDRARTGLVEAPDGCDMRMSIMTTFPGPRTSAEIRAYLKTRLNQALRRPGMFGGEMALRLLLVHLAYAEHEDQEWARALRTLESRGAFNSLGMTGALSTVLPVPCQDAVASIYAELAQDHGWLHADTTLTAEEHASLRRRRSWTARCRPARRRSSAPHCPFLSYLVWPPVRGQPMGPLRF
jgi:hypothetical protein